MSGFSTTYEDISYGGNQETWYLSSEKTISAEKTSFLSLLIKKTNLH